MDDENSLDRRLVEAKEAAIKLERMFAENKRNDSKKKAHFEDAAPNNRGIDSYQEQAQYERSRVEQDRQSRFQKMPDKENLAPNMNNGGRN